MKSKKTIIKKYQHTLYPEVLLSLANGPVMPFIVRVQFQDLLLYPVAMSL